MEIANTTLKQTLGLMFRKNGEILFIFGRRSSYSIWTPFMRFNIDVFFFDKDLKLVDKKKGMKPWRFYKPKEEYLYSFECEEGKYTEKQVLKKIKTEIICSSKT